MLGIPTFCLYVKALTTPDFRFERKHAVHFIPFVIGLALIGQSHWLQIAVKVVVVLPYLVLAHIQVTGFCNSIQRLHVGLSHFFI